MLCAWLAFGAVQAVETNKDVVKVETRDGFETIAANVRREMGADGRYAYIKAEERVKVEASLAEMDTLFVEHGSVDTMDKAAKVRLFNAQEVVNSILTLRDRDRLICERGASTGSRIVSTSCRTYGELEAAQQASRKFMNEKAASPCNTTVCQGK
jgi:hypothetical protein